MPAPPNPLDPSNGDRLESWKEIAAYLSKGVRTVIRWEQNEGLPVHRHPHEKRSSVFAYKSEIDTWRRSRPTEVSEPPTPPKRRWLILGSTVAGAALVASLIWALRAKPEASPTLPLKAEPLTSYPGHQYSPSFSPDGSHFAFAWDGPKLDNFDIYVQAVGMAEPRRLTDHPHFDYSPAWAPDGRWIAFLRRTPQLQVEVRLIPAMGGTERKLTDLGIPLYQEATELAWSPDSRWLAFSDVDATGPGLFLLSVETGERRRLTRTKHTREHLDPSFSPDGRALAFRCQDLDNVSEICVLNLTPESGPEGEPEQVTHLGMRSTSPIWTAGGDGVFFSAGVWLSDTSLYRLRLVPGDPGSRKPQQLTAAAGEDHFSLAYSRHNHQLAYTRYSGDINIWALRYDGGRWMPRTLSPLSSSRTDVEPDFSPDGRHVAFVSDRSGSMEVWVAREDGTQLRQLTSLGARLARTPKWSPDGRRIAFWSCGPGQSSVQVIEAEGGRPRELVKDARDESWSRDGRWLYYRSDAASGTIRKLAVGGGGSSIEVVGGDAANPTESPDGQFLYFQRPDGIWRMPVGGGTAERVVTDENRFPYAFTFRQDGLFTLEVLKGGHYRPSLKFHSFAGNPASELVSITSGRTMLGMTASPDGKTILFCLLDQGRHNLMLVRGVQ